MKVTEWMIVMWLLVVALVFGIYGKKPIVKVQEYSLFEYCFPSTKQYKNPFNFSEVNIQARISTGHSQEIKIDGFYYQRFTRSQSNGEEVLTPMGSPQWCIRYTPVNEGEHTVLVTITDKEGTRSVSNQTFQAEAANSSATGFVIVADNNVHFQDSHTKMLYIPCGENVCWVKENQGTYGYDHYFNSLSQNGANYARLWLTNNDFDDLAVEVANFNISLTNTWRLDYVVQLAERLQIRLLMCTESFNCFSSVPKMPGFWNKDCYYNKRFGGILDKPEDFFTDEGAMNDYKMRLRYLVARYGYSTSVFAWEFFNEVDLTDNYSSENQVRWIKEMSSYLKGIDVNNHLVSTSFSHSDGDPNVQKLAEIDFTMTHNYGATDIVAQTAQYAAIKQSKYKKPSYVAEFGVNNYSNDDKSGVSLHNGLWAPLFSMGAGTCMTWWWDSWVDPHNFYHIFKSVSQLINDQLSHIIIQEWEPVETEIDTNLRVYGMAAATSDYSIKTVLISDPCYTWKNIADGKQCKQYSGVTLTIRKCVDGSVYDATWYNTQATDLKIVFKDQVMCQDEMLKVSVPAFTNDTAALFAKKMS